MRCTMPRLNRAALGLYLVFGPQDLNAPTQAPDLIKQARAGGVSCVQWRDKSARAQAPLDARISDVAPLQTLARSLSLPFVINDDVELAVALKADGVHLGQDDMPPAQARQRLGQDAIIGWSVGTLDERARLDAVLQENTRIIDYIGVGPAFATGTKADAGQALGAAGINAVIAGLTLPIVAIGGINIGNASLLKDTRIDGIAVVSAIAGSASPKQAAEDLKMTPFGSSAT